MELIENLIDIAEHASNDFSNYTTGQIESIIQAVSQVQKEKSEFYANWSIRETGYGNMDDTIRKCQDCPDNVLKKYRLSDFIEPSINVAEKIITLPKPAGIIVALIPSSNPIMTVYYKTMFSIMTRNTIIFSAHPAVKECTTDLVNLIAKVAQDSGMPEGAIQIMSDIGVTPLNYLMSSERIHLILATGGAGRVRAAYHSGRPAFGMGPGNPVCFVDQSADINMAAEHIISSNSFDNALACVSESVVLAEQTIDKKLKQAVELCGGYFTSKTESEKLRSFLFNDAHQINRDCIGKSASWIAQQIGLSIPENTKSLLIEIDEVGAHEPISLEKLFPVLGYLVVNNIEAAILAASSVLDSAGKGHSAIIHSNNTENVMRYARALPVCRLVVNTEGVKGSSGSSTNLGIGPMVGTGFFGGSAIDENIGPQHLIQHTRVAYPIHLDISMDGILTNN